MMHDTHDTHAIADDSRLDEQDARADRPALPADQSEDTFNALREELIGYYRKELAFIYTYHDIPPIEYYTPVKAIVARLILHLNGQKLHDVLAACWQEAWRREPVCHPKDFL